MQVPPTESPSRGRTPKMASQQIVKDPVILPAIIPTRPPLEPQVEKVATGITSGDVTPNVNSDVTSDTEIIVSEGKVSVKRALWLTSCSYQYLANDVGVVAVRHRYRGCAGEHGGRMPVSEDRRTRQVERQLDFAGVEHLCVPQFTRLCHSL